MKALFDKLAGGNLGDLGNTLQNVLGGNNTQNQQAPQQNTSQNSNSGLLGNMGGVAGLAGATAVGGLLGALFTGKKTKKIAETALTVGGTAAVGALAWNFYKKWSQTKGQAPNATPTAPQAPTTADTAQEMTPMEEQTTLVLLEAMVYAARADGHIDEEERAAIQQVTAELFPGEDMKIIDSFLTKPIDPSALAAKMQNHEEGVDLYRISCVAVKIDSFMERTYLDGLANALKLSEQEKTAIEVEAMQIQQNMAAQA